ncbi:MAG: FHA domain-containing protein [Pseudomonadota bacterium]
MAVEGLKAEPKEFIQRARDRRLETTSVGFPLLDSDFNIVREDRRRISDRRKSNLKLIWQENQPIRNSSTLTLRFGDQKYFFDTHLKSFTLGRSLQSDLRVDNRFVSKQHASISYNNGEFVLMDRSLNGTFIKTEDLGKIRIHGQKVYLYGTGVISLGHPLHRNEEVSCIHFNCD